MRLRYAAHEYDNTAIHALSLLRDAGRSARVLPAIDIIDPYAVTLFSAPGRYDDCICYDPNEFEERGIVIPAWAFELPFLVALKEFGKRDFYGLTEIHRTALGGELHLMHAYFCRKFWQEHECTYA